MIAEGVKLLIGAVFAIHDEGLVIGHIELLAKIFEDGGHFRFEAFAQKLSAHVFVAVILTGDDIERSLAVTGLNAFKPVDFHVFEERAALRQFVAKEGRIGVVGIDGFAASHAATETNDYHIWPAIVRAGGLCEQRRGRGQKGRASRNGFKEGSSRNSAVRHRAPFGNLAMSSLSQLPLNSTHITSIACCSNFLSEIRVTSLFMFEP